VEEHGLTIEEVEEVLESPTSKSFSKSSKRPCVWGCTLESVYLMIVYEEIDEDTIRVVTAYEIPEPRGIWTMAKKLERIFREQPLTPAEAAQDAEIQRKVEAEFPPLARSGNNLPPDEGQAKISGLLKRCIRDSGKSV
jgi:hypothetical protein